MCSMRCIDTTPPDSSLINLQIQLCTCSLTILFFTTLQKNYLAGVLSNFKCKEIWMI